MLIVGAELSVFCFSCSVLNKRLKLREDPENWGCSTVEKYEIKTQVGEGTYGQVYKAHDRVTSKLVIHFFGCTHRFFFLRRCVQHAHFYYFLLVCE